MLIKKRKIIMKHSTISVVVIYSIFISSGYIMSMDKEPDAPPNTPTIINQVCGSRKEYIHERLVLAAERACLICGFILEQDESEKLPAYYNEYIVKPKS